METIILASSSYNQIVVKMLNINTATNGKSLSCALMRLFKRCPNNLLAVLAWLDVRFMHRAE